MTDKIIPDIGDPVKLYDPASAAVAVFSGSPIAGGLLVRRNFLAVGDRRSAGVWMLISIVLTVAVFSLAFFLPDDTPNMIFGAINAALALGYSEIIRKNFGKEIEVRKILKKGLYSRLRPVGIGVLCGVSLLRSFSVSYIFAKPQDITPPKISLSGRSS